MVKEINSQDVPVNTDFEIWKLLDHTRFMIARSREIELSQFCLTPEKAHVLDILNRHKGVTTINEIVEVTQRQHHSISTLINRMVKQGLVEKKKFPDDNRKYEVVITKKGQKLYKKISVESVTCVNDTFSCLSDTDRKELSAHLRSLLTRSYKMAGKELKPRLATQ